MKVFWAVLLLVILGSVAYLALGRDGKPSRSSPPAPPIVSTPDPRRAPGEKDPDEAAFFDGALAPAPAAPAPKPEEHTLKVETPAPAPAPAATAEKTEPAPPPVVERTPETPVPADSSKPASDKPKEPATPTTEAPTTAPAAPTPVAPPATKPASTPVTFGDDAKVVKNDDGSMLIDDKYPLKGEGTKESPFLITWEYLISAQEDYQPRLGKKKLPGRMKLITGKYVKITGFVAFPIMATEPTEMLAMLNQWDGCCIGIPPTPYDAIEVKLAEAADNEERLTTYGSVEGKLTVEPYLVRDWLVSLYTMEEARMQKAH